MPTKTIKFNPTTKLAEISVKPPQPARDYWPEWYKKADAFDSQSKKFEIGDDFKAKRGLKLCVPFMDAMSTGYIQETWQDIYFEVTKTDGEDTISYTYPAGPDIMSLRETASMKVGNDFYPYEFTFHPAWAPQVPAGYSVLYMTPFNRLDLPFQFANGLVDSDTFTQNTPHSNIPFYLKKGFSGILPKGTPFLQMIPIKRENWESITNEYSEHEIVRIGESVRQLFYGGYKKLYWQKKSYK